MAPLWRWSEDVKPRTGKDEAVSVAQDSDDSEDMDHTSVGRKKFVPFNRFENNEGNLWMYI